MTTNSTKLVPVDISSSKTVSRSHKHHKKEVPIRVAQPSTAKVTLDSLKLQSDSKNEFKCQHCSESFEFKSMLIIHELSHRRKVCCQVCNKKVYKTNYDEHMESHLAKKSFICDYCGLQFARKYMVMRHMRVHIKTKIYECEEFGKEFNSITHYKNHKFTHIDAKPWKCDLCPEKYTLKKLLEYHMIARHQSEVKLHCNIDFCDFSTTNYRQLEIKEHVESVHGIEKDKTRFFEQTKLIEKLSRKRVKDEVKGDVKIIAKNKKNVEKGGEEISDKTSITIPLTKPPKLDLDPPLNPSTSVKITSKVPSPSPQPLEVKTEVLFEIKLNHGKTPTIIPTSNAKEIPKILEGSSNIKVFTVETALELLSKESKIRIKNEIDQKFEIDQNIEVKVEPQDVEPNFQPDELYNVIKEEPQEIMDYQITPYVPDDQRRRISYRKTRRKAPASIFPTKNYPFCCSICGLSFAHQSILLMHKMTHQKDFVQVFECDLCSKTFKDKFSLEMHINVTHRQQRTYECNTCDFTTVNIKTFRNHKLKHLKNLPQCEICNKSFNKQSSLLAHVQQIHQIDKSVPCGVCGKFFKSMNYVMRHIKTTHAGDMKFQCVYCDKSFATRGELNQHVGSLWRIGKCKTHIKSELSA